MSLRDEVASNAYGKESEICPVHCVKVFPTFNVTVDEGSNEEIHHESYCLKHQCTLTESQSELFLVVTQVRSDNSGDHEERNNAVEDSSDNGIIECLSENMLLLGT